jgi:hypothetical protein
MAIYDPTQQIKELGQKATNALDKAGSSFVGMEQSKTAQTERIMGQIQSIRDEAELMHQEALQDEIDSTLSEISSEIFKQRKSGATTIDMKGFTNLNRKKASLKNMATNSKIAAKIGGDVLAMAMQDPYTMNRAEVSGSIMSAIADVDLLKMDPTELQQRMAGLYTDSVDNIAKVADIVKKFGVEKGQYGYQDEETKERFNVNFSKVKGLMDNKGFVTDDGKQKIAQEARNQGLSFSEQDVNQVIDRLSSSRSVTRDYGTEERKLKVSEENAKTRSVVAARKAVVSNESFNDGYSRFVNGVTSGNLAESAAAAAAKDKISFITKKTFIEMTGGENLPPEFTEILDSYSDNQKFGIQVDGEYFSLTKNGLQQAYVTSVNSSLGQDDRKALQGYKLNEDGINLYNSEQNILPQLEGAV